MELTRVDQFGEWYAKRDDLACFFSVHMPAGSKVRQYLSMAEKQPGAPMVVGCSAYSAQQIYVAYAAKRCGCRGLIFVPGRKQWTAATEWCAQQGAEVHEVRPGYPSVYRAAAKAAAKALGGCVRWDVAGAVNDSAAQAANIPDCVRRVIVPTGSGLVAAGVLAGLAGRNIRVAAIAVSPLATAQRITELAELATAGKPLPPLDFIPLPGKYERPAFAKLPDGTVLDPFYAAKALPMVQAGDCFWITGTRGLSAMPMEACRA